LPWPVATLATNFEGLGAGGRGQARLSVDLFPDAAGDQGAGRRLGLRVGDVEVGLVQGKRLNEVGVALQDPLDGAGPLLVHLHPRGDEDETWALPIRLHGRLGGVDAVGPRLSPFRGGTLAGSVGHCPGGV
jgi:hypothetical protein